MMMAQEEAGRALWGGHRPHGQLARGSSTGWTVSCRYEQPVFLGVLVAALAFEGAWRLARGTNAVVALARDASRPRS
jgi:hypothetical protein